MNSLPTEQNQHEPSAEAAKLAVGRRRRLLLGGASAPLLLTIASRPAWAGGETCTQSALASANLSGQTAQLGCGESAGFWSEKQYAWPVDISPAELFKDIFAVTEITKGNTTVDFGPMTLGVVIKLNGSENPHKLGLHAVGALVNAYAYPTYHATNPGFPYTPLKVIELFNDFAASDPEGLADLFEKANNDYDHLSSWPH